MREQDSPESLLDHRRPISGSPSQHGGERMKLGSTQHVCKHASLDLYKIILHRKPKTSSHGLNISPKEIDVLCHKEENYVVGAPCGVMDQVTSSCGEANKLFAMVCQLLIFYGGTRKS